MTKVAVVLGAGASKDVWNRLYEPPVSWAPPLAQDLFGTDNSATLVKPLLRKYRGADFLSSQIVPHIREDWFSIERELSNFSLTKRSSPATYKNFLEVPAYLRDLTYQVCEIYGVESGSYAQLVHGLLDSNRHDVAFVSLNYDNILETELDRFDPDTYSFTKLSDYIQSQRGAKVFKLHGSVNWFRAISEVSSEYPDDDWRTAVRGHDPLTQQNGSVKVLNGVVNTTDQQHWNGTRAWVYPVLTAPVASKSTDQMALPPRMSSVLEAFLNDCWHFLIIGCSGVDQDLLEVLANSVGNAATVQFVAESDDSLRLMQKNFTDKVPGFLGAYSQPIPDKFTGGFRNYVSSEHFERFIDLIGEEHENGAN